MSEIIETKAPEALEEPEKAYTFRTLTARDVFPMVAIIRKIGFKEFRSVFDAPEVKQAMLEAQEGNDSSVSSIGFEVVVNLAGVIVEHLGDAEQEIFSFLASVSDLSVQQVMNLPLGTFVEMILDLTRKDEFKDFFKAVARLMK